MWRSRAGPPYPRRTALTHTRQSAAARRRRHSAGSRSRYPVCLPYAQNDPRLFLQPRLLRSASAHPNKRRMTPRRTVRGETAAPACSRQFVALLEFALGHLLRDFALPCAFRCFEESPGGQRSPSSDGAVSSSGASRMASTRRCRKKDAKKKLALRFQPLCCTGGAMPSRPSRNLCDLRGKNAPPRKITILKPDAV
jgi:hypothetical protein